MQQLTNFNLLYTLTLWVKFYVGNQDKIEKIILEYHIFNENSIKGLEKIIEKLEMYNFQIIKKPYSDVIGLIYAIKKDHNVS